MAAAANQKARQVVEEDLANVEFETSEDVEVIPTFDSMGLREDLLRGIYAYGNYLFSRIAVDLRKVTLYSLRAILPID